MKQLWIEALTIHMDGTKGRLKDACSMAKNGKISVISAMLSDGTRILIFFWF